MIDCPTRRLCCFSGGTLYCIAFNSYLEGRVEKTGNGRGKGEKGKGEAGKGRRGAGGETGGNEDGIKRKIKGERMGVKEMARENVRRPLTSCVPSFEPWIRHRENLFGLS